MRIEGTAQRKSKIKIKNKKAQCIVEERKREEKRKNLIGLLDVDLIENLTGLAAAASAAVSSAGILSHN